MECSENGKNGFKWGENGACYLHDGTPEGMKAAKEKCIKQGLAEGGGKLENAGPSIEYLTAFHRFVSSHPHIYGQVKEEIHKRARASAGGQAKAKKVLDDEISFDDLSLSGESPVKAFNAAYQDGDIIETDEYFDVPTVFAKEGVFTGTNGIPTLKKYEVLKANAPRFLGVPITDKHLQTDTLRPDDRWLGHAISATPRDDKRDIFGISRYYKKDLKPEEVAKIQNKQFPDASPGYFTITKSETGDFDGIHYDAIEEGPYNVVEYANFFDGTKGACSQAMGCGPFQNQAPDDVLVLTDGNVRKCPKKLNEANKMAEDIEAVKADFTKQLNAANEIITGQAASITALTGKISELTTKLDGIANEHKILNEAFQKKATDEVTARDAANKGEFKKTLNAAAASEVDALWTQVKTLNPAEYEAWKITNSAKLLTEAERKDPKGKKQLNASGFDLAAEQAKVFNY